jgi:hypothetical protein
LSEAVVTCKAPGVAVNGDDGATASPDLQKCLVRPPPQLLSSTFQLVEVANRLEGQDVEGAREMIYSIDLDACHWYWKECGRRRKLLHEPLRHSDYKRNVNRFNVPARMRIELAKRDGWRCRYCSLPLVHPDFLNAVRRALPPEDFPAAPAPMEGTAFPARRLFKLVPDHVVPRAAGGLDDASNLVSSCGACNFAKVDCTIDELRLSNPFQRDPIQDGWEGLRGRARRLRGV